MTVVAIVTGASSGLGRAIYAGLGRDRRELGIDKVVGISRHGSDISVDLTRLPPQQQWPTLLGGEPIKIRLLVNCAGILPLDDSPRVFLLNFWAPHNLIRELLPFFDLEEGCIINIASVSGLIAEPDLPLYAASKAALISLTRSLAVKYAPGLRVNAISPGLYDTNLVSGPAPQDLVDKVPMGYEEKPENLYPVVRMILETKYMTGANIVIDGGVSCRVA